MKLQKKSFKYYPFLIFLIAAFIVNPTQATQRFLDNGDNTVTDSESGLMWQKNTPSPIVSPAVNWAEAIRKCKELRLGGYDDWRLPTKEEWETIIDRNNQYPALVYPNPFGNVIVNSPYWTASEYSYGPDYTCDSSGCPLKSHVVLLYLGYMGYQSKNNLAFFWPVRNLKTESSPQEIVKTAKRIPAMDIVKKVRINTAPQSEFISTILFRPEIFSDEVKLLGIDKSSKINNEGSVSTPITENSRVLLKSKEDDIQIVINLYQIDLRRVALFNNNAMMMSLPVRMRLNEELSTLMFFENIE